MILFCYMQNHTVLNIKNVFVYWISKLFILDSEKEVSEDKTEETETEEEEVKAEGKLNI